MQTSSPTEKNSSNDGFVDCWNRLPNKDLFIPLLIVWLLLFQFLGNSTFGYVNTPSLFHWMYNAYNSESPTADDGHGNLIPFVVLGLFWWKRKELLAQPASVWWPGVILVALGLVMHITGYLTQQTRICIIALFTGLYGIMGMAWGPKWLKATFFPFFLFFFMVPLGSLTDPITFPLRMLVSKIVAFTSDNVLGIKVLREGTRLFNSHGKFEYEVAAACSGIRSLVAIAAIAIIYAFMVFRSWKLRFVLLLAALPLAIIGNTFRMMVIILTAEIWGQKAGNYVHEGGPAGILSLIPYIPAIIGLLLLGRLLERIQDKQAPPPSEIPPSVPTVEPEQKPA